MKSKAEIVVETLRYYNLKNRGYNAEDKYCTYLDKSTGVKCAVGRCILDSEIENVSKFEQNYVGESDGGPSVKTLAEKFADLDSLLIPEYRGHDVGFWKDLQYIHDSAQMWTEDGFDASESNISFISIAVGEEVAKVVKEAFAEKTA